MQSRTTCLRKTQSHEGTRRLAEWALHLAALFVRGLQWLVEASFTYRCWKSGWMWWFHLVLDSENRGYSQSLPFFQNFLSELWKGWKEKWSKDVNKCLCSGLAKLVSAESLHESRGWCNLFLSSPSFRSQAMDHLSWSCWGGPWKTESLQIAEYEF